jgi:dienelactone hydrolase
MAAAADALADYDRTQLTAEGKARDVYRIGSGPAVIVISEMPGITPRVADFGRLVAREGFTAVLPHLFGEPGRAMSPAYVMSSVSWGCVSREFSTLALRRTSPVTSWLRALARSMHAELGGPGVGVVGMCFTGGFALAMMVDDAVMAPVLSQPSLPFALTAAHRRDLGISDDDLARVKARVRASAAGSGDRASAAGSGDRASAAGSGDRASAAGSGENSPGVCLLALRFSGDRLVPGERFQRLRDELGDGVVTVEIDSLPGNAWGIKRNAHSVLTEELVADDPDHPTRHALDQVLDLFRTRLRPAPGA